MLTELAGLFSLEILWPMPRKQGQGKGQGSLLDQIYFVTRVSFMKAKSSTKFKNRVLSLPSVALGYEPPSVALGVGGIVTKLPRNDSENQSSFRPTGSAESFQPWPSLYSLHLGPQVS